MLILISSKTEAQSSVFAIVDDLLLKGDYQKALVLLEKQEPITIEVLDKTASIYQTTGNYTKAIECYDKALKIEQNEALQVKLGNVYNSAGLTTKAIAVFENIIEKDTSNLLVANSLGKLYLGQNKAKKAERMFRFLKKKDSLNPNYPFQLAEALSKQNKPFKMGQSYLDAYNLDTMHIKSIYELSKFFKELRLKDSTMLFIDKGLEIDSININFLQLKVNQLYFSKNFDETIIYLNKLDSLNFKSVNTYEMFGMCYYNLKDFEKAEASYKSALRIERNNPKILYRLATLYYEKKDIEKAKLYLRMSIVSAKPEIDKQYFLFGTIFKEEHNLKMALGNFEKAYQNNYHNYKALFEVAITSDAYFKDKKIALNHYKKYFQQFESRDKEMTEYVIQRIKELKKELFLEGEIID